MDPTVVEELEGLIEKLVTSGEITLNKEKMKQLKSFCKKSNACLEHTFHVLFTQLQKDHSEVRYSVFQIASELFVRSHLFRTLLLEKFQEFMDLTIETDFDNPLPPPKQTADKLKQEALCAIRDWHAKYGIAYQKLSLGFDFLKQVKKIKFDQPQPISRSRATEQMLSRKQIVNGVKLDKLKKELDANLWEVKGCTAEINSCLGLIVPTFEEETSRNDKSSTSQLSEVPESPATVGNSQSNLTELREVGLPERGYVVQLDLSEVSAMKVSQTADNHAVFDHVKDCVKSGNRIHMPRLRKWLIIAGKCGASPELIKKLIDFKSDMQVALDKYDEIKVSHDSDASDDDGFDDFIEVPEQVNSSTINSKSTAKKLHEKPDEKLPISKRYDTNVWTPLRRDDDLQDPTTYKYALAHNTKLLEEKNKSDKTKKLQKILPTKKKNHKQDNSTENLLRDKAPVISFGHDLFTWDKEKYKELQKNLVLGAPKEYDIGHRFYGAHSASEGDVGVSDAALSSITSRTIEFAGEFQPVVRSCRAPLPNGKLCPRQDRFKCPFHGKIINRDSNGNPVSRDGPSTSFAPPPDNGWQDPAFLHELEKSTGIDLTVKKKGKRKAKTPENGLTDLKKMKDTSRSRLQRKVLNPGSLKRVSDTLDTLDTKRNLDKFGNNFNYALH